MLSPLEKLLFLLLAVGSPVATTLGLWRIIRLIGAGQGRPNWSLAATRLATVLARTVVFQPTFRSRLGISLLHALIGWGFLVYLPVNVLDALRAFGVILRIPLPLEKIGGFLTDTLSGAVLLATVFFLVRRFVFRPAALTARPQTSLLEAARHGIARDSAIVATFLLVHIGARLIGQSFALAHLRLSVGAGDSTQPLANLLASLWLSLPGPNLAWLPLAHRLSFWVAFGSIFLFLPYFPFSKHLHLLAAPINLLLKPPRRSMGEMNFVNLEDASLERLGAETLADFAWEQLLDAYACIMCFRCQEICPAYQTGKVLSPATLEINKRYALKQARGRETLSTIRLTERIIPEEAIWACTTCGACVDVCPVGNEPMRDILDIRRALTLMKGAFPAPLEITFRNLERSGNPWGMPPSERLRWAEGLAVPTVAQNPQADLLWWVGCAAAFDPRAQEAARAFARLLLAAGVNFAVLGEGERCTADMARRAGREDIFFANAQANVEILNACAPKRIVTTCPHCLHVLKNEYPSFSGQYTVIHHTQLLEELMREGRLPTARTEGIATTFHDPCYLARQNGIVAAPRNVLRGSGVRLVEMPRHGRRTFCCGAGGAQMWKEEEAGAEHVRAARLAEAQRTTTNTLTVSCPFCLTMLGDAAGASTVAVRELAEIAAEGLEM